MYRILPESDEDGARPRVSVYERSSLEQEIWVMIPEVITCTYT